MPWIFFFCSYSAQFKLLFKYEVKYSAVNSMYCLNSYLTLTGTGQKIDRDLCHFDTQNILIF